MQSLRRATCILAPGACGCLAKMPPENWLPLLIGVLWLARHSWKCITLTFVLFLSQEAHILKCSDCCRVFCETLQKNHLGRMGKEMSPLAIGLRREAHVSPVMIWFQASAGNIFCVARPIKSFIFYFVCWFLFCICCTVAPCCQGRST